MPDDEIKILTSIEGSEAVEAALGRQVKSVEALGDSATQTQEPLANMNEGMTVLGSIAGTVSPKMGFFVQTLASAQVATVGLGGGIASLTLAVKGLIAPLLNPVFIVFASVIAIGVKLMRDLTVSTAEAAAKQEELNKSLERHKELQEAAKAREGERVQTGVEFRVGIGRELAEARALRGVGQVGAVARAAVEASQITSIPLETTRQVAIDFARRGAVPTAEAVAQEARVRYGVDPQGTAFGLVNFEEAARLREGLGAAAGAATGATAAQAEAARFRAAFGQNEAGLSPAQMRVLLHLRERPNVEVHGNWYQAGDPFEAGRPIGAGPRAGTAKVGP